MSEQEQAAPFLWIGRETPPKGENREAHVLLDVADLHEQEIVIDFDAWAASLASAPGLLSRRFRFSFTLKNETP
jgi:hypothetical protein